jgi:15-cis-phytoene desaturase
VNADAVIAGAGVAGMRCALALADAGLRVVVLEGDAFAGGRAASWADEETGLQVDIGPHVVTSEHRNFLAFLARLGTDKEVCWQRRPLITLDDAKGRLRMPRPWLPVPLHGLPMLPRALTRLSLADAWSHRRIAWQAMRSTEASLLELDTEDAHAWLQGQGVSPKAIEWFWRSALLALLNVRPEQCSAASAMRVFRLMLGRSGWHFGFPKIGLAQLFVPGTCRAVMRSGGQVLFGARVRRVIVERQQVVAVETDDGHRIATTRCVLALPPQETGMVAAASSEEPLAPLVNVCRYFRPAPYVSTYVWFDRPVTRDRFWARAWSPQGLNTDFYNLSAIRPSMVREPTVIACNAIGPLARDWPQDRIVEHTLGEIREYAPAAKEARVRHARVHRVPMAIPQPRPGTEAMRPPNATGVDGLWIAGDWTRTALPCSMESAARSGALAAEALLAHAGRTPPRIAIDAPDTRGLVGLLRKRTA